MTKHEYTPPAVVELGTPDELILGSNVNPSESDPEFKLSVELVAEYDE